MPSKHPLECHIDSLRKFCLSLCKDRELADDLCQEALYKALAAWPPKDRSMLRSWLFKIAYHAFLDSVRRPTLHLMPAEVVEFKDPGASSEEQLFNNQLLQLFGNLSREHREVLYLIAVLGLAYRDAAEILSIPQGTVMSRLSRARESLKQMIVESKLEVEANER